MISSQKHAPGFVSSRLMLPVFVLLTAMLSACSSSSGGVSNPAPSGDFELRTVDRDLILIEGDEAGLSIPLALDRQNGHNNPVQLTLEGISAEDLAFVSSSFTRLTLTPDADNSQAILRLAIADIPLMPQQRQFRITASDGIDQDQHVISVEVRPVDAPDIYLLIGQKQYGGFQRRRHAPGLCRWTR